MAPMVTYVADCCTMFQDVQVPTLKYDEALSTLKSNIVKMDQNDQIHITYYVYLQ